MIRPAQPFDIQAKFNTIASQTTPLLPSKELHGFVQYYFNQRRRYFKIIEKHSAPLYLLESAVLREKACQFKQAFENYLTPLSFYYAVKSNNHPDVARILLDEGFGLDVSSGLELKTALELGATDIVFSGPGKTEEELQLAAANAGQVVVLLDSPGELSRVAAIAAKLKKLVRCGVRLNVNPNGLWRKFGITLESLPAFWDAAQQCSHIRLAGLQFHTSWNLTPVAQIAFIRKLGAVLAQMPEVFRAQLEFVDIGGGYWPPQGEWLQPAATPEGRLRLALNEPVDLIGSHHCYRATSIEAFAEKLSLAIQQHLFSVTICRICLEPGRWICNDAFHLFVSVVDKKASDLVITDAGTNAVGWERFESDYFPILNLTRPSLDEKPCNILGSLCTPHDVWGYMYFGDCIEPGDILMIPTQGAYTYSLRQNFIKPLPQVVVH